MPFDKVDTQVNFPAQEQAILDFWNRAHAFEQLCAKNLGKPPWSFLDGPITANNPMGVHHAWGRTYKDAYQRYFAMTGHEERYQNGFDCQGLWVEVEVEKQLNLKSKRDIENLVPGDRFASIDLFVQRCKERVDTFARRQTGQSIRLGYWMNWDRDGDWDKPPDERRSYFTMSAENNYTIWNFLRKCHERSLIYRGYDSMPWCPRCGVGISQMEMHEGYVLVEHRAIFVRFPLKDRPGENLLIWTTTPWTLSSNVAAAVNPSLTYLRVEHRDQIFYVAKGAFTAHRLEEQFRRKEWLPGVPRLKALEQIFKEKGGYTILGEFLGSEMIGWSYRGPFDELPAQEHPSGFPAEVAEVARKQGWASDKASQNIHRVIAWEQVGESEGTGIVHIAPGCGKEDFALGKAEHLVAIAPLDESGEFISGFGKLQGKSAVNPATVDLIFSDLQEKGLFFASERYPHSYPHCWRCKTELLFRLVDEWFINMSWRDEIMRICHDIRWIPDFGLQRELDWLRNMGDWMISKKRYWGLALPIWVCDKCARFQVIGSREELQERAIQGWQEFDGHSPHRPWIDLVKIACRACGGVASRIPDVGNPWLDAGIVPYSTLGYNRDRAQWEKWFPADFIVESLPGQFRNWFYALLAMSTMMSGRAPFKTLLGHGLVRDEKGEEMHKSKGNAIPFDEAADKMGADVMRWMFCRHNPVNNINFGYGPAEELLTKFILKLWNTYAFFSNYARLDNFDPKLPEIPVHARPDIDRWILSDLQLLVQTARREFERFNVQAFCLQVEQFVDDRLSNWYVRRNRRRFWRSEQTADKQAAYQTLYSVLTTLTRLIAPVVPFLSEAMYQNLTEFGPDTPVSVHLCDYPSTDESLIDADLSADMEAVLRLVSLGSAARNTVKLKVRQPLAEMKVQPVGERDRRAIKRFADQIGEELNVKKITEHDPKLGTLLTYEVKPNPKSLGPKVGPRLKDIQQALARHPYPASLAEAKNAGQPVRLGLADGEDVVIEAADLVLESKQPPGWAAAEERGTVVALDTRLTTELKQEGIAREIVRQVQELRKKAGLEMEDRIALFLHSESPTLQAAIERHRTYISNETLAISAPLTPLNGEDIHKAQPKLDGSAVNIELRRAVAP